MCKLAVRRNLIWYSLFYIWYVLCGISCADMMTQDDESDRRKSPFISFFAQFAVYFWWPSRHLSDQFVENVCDMASMIKYKLPLPNFSEEMLYIRNQYVTYEKHYRDDDEHFRLILIILEKAYAAFLLSGPNDCLDYSCFSSWSHFFY